MTEEELVNSVILLKKSLLFGAMSWSGSASALFWLIQCAQRENLGVPCRRLWSERENVGWFRIQEDRRRRRFERLVLFATIDYNRRRFRFEVFRWQNGIDVNMSLKTCIHIVQQRNTISVNVLIQVVVRVVLVQKYSRWSRYSDRIHRHV